MFMGPWDQGGPWSADRDRRRPSLPEPGLDAGASIRTAASPAIPDAGKLPAGEDAADAERASCAPRRIGRCAT